MTVCKPQGHRKRAAAYWRALLGPNMGYADERGRSFLVLTEVLVLSLILSELTGKVSIDEFSCNSFRTGPGQRRTSPERREKSWS